jgi:hypothetical protein
MHEERALVALDSIPPEELRPEFRAGVARLLQVRAGGRPCAPLKWVPGCGACHIGWRRRAPAGALKLA